MSDFAALLNKQRDGAARNLEDVWIAVMGVTGSGKSTFVQVCADLTGPSIVGHGMKSCTQDVGEYAFIWPYDESIRIHLIDTPGFDDTERKDAEVLKDIAGWLAETYKAEIRMNGILYLHRIIDPRMAGTALRNLRVFMRLCGSDCLPNVVLATTMWSGVPRHVGEAREKELVETEEFWGYMKKHGSTVMRLGGESGDRESVLGVLKVLVDKREKLTLKIQHEIVEEDKKIIDTLAGQQLDEDIRLIQEKHKEEMLELQKATRQAIKDNDALARAHYQKMEKNLMEKMEAAERSREELYADLEKLEKERKVELDRLTSTVNGQVKELERMAQEREQLATQLRNGQGNTAQLKEHLDATTRKLQELEKAQEVNRAKATKKRSGLPSGLGHFLVDAMLPWPASMAYKMIRYVDDKVGEED